MKVKIVYDFMHRENLVGQEIEITDPLLQLAENNDVMLTTNSSGELTIWLDQKSKKFRQR